VFRDCELKKCVNSPTSKYKILKELLIKVLDNISFFLGPPVCDTQIIAAIFNSMKICTITGAKLLSRGIMLPGLCMLLVMSGPFKRLLT
jgi:hypothetical protein